MATAIQEQLEIAYLARQNSGTATSYNRQGNHQGAALSVLSLPINTEVARMKQTYVAGTLTAVAPVAAIPTTASHLSLYCPASGTISLVIHRISAYCVVSAGAALVIDLAAHVTTVSVTSITGTAAQTPKGISGQNTATATIFSAVTTVNNGNWHVLGAGANAGAATATIGMGADSGDLGGLYVINPGMHLDLAVLCSAAGSATFSTFVTWSEVQC